MSESTFALAAKFTLSARDPNMPARFLMYTSAIGSRNASLYMARSLLDA